MKYTTFRWRAKISFSPKGRDCTTDLNHIWDVVNYIITYATKKEKEVCDALKDIIRNIDQTSKKTPRKNYLIIIKLSELL